MRKQSSQVLWPHKQTKEDKLIVDSWRLALGNNFVCDDDEATEKELRWTILSLDVA